MDRQSYRVAIIDLGSNTARLIVMQTVPGYAYRLVDEIREVVRLQKGMTKKGLHKKAIERVLTRSSPQPQPPFEKPPTVPNLSNAFAPNWISNFKSSKANEKPIWAYWVC